MYYVQIIFRGQGKHKEVIVGDCAGTASVTRNLVGNSLIMLYEQVIIDDVSVQFLPCKATPEDDYCIVHAQARCRGKQWPQYDEQAMAVEIEAEIAPPLVELFGSVMIELISVSDAL